MNANDPLWPYLLFLPQDPRTRDEFIRTILASRLARNVFLSFDEESKVYQRDLIHNLPHSNKSILKYLEKLGDFGLITTNTAVRGGKRVVYHELTDKGQGIASFFFKELPSDLGDLTASLLENYILRLVTLYRNQGMPESAIFDIFTRIRGLTILNGSIEYDNPDVALFGASAFYSEINCDRLPDAGGVSSCSMPLRYPGGPSVELALVLAADGHKVTFGSVVGNDQHGYNVISDLVQQNVDVTQIEVADNRRTNETLILHDKQGSRFLIGYSEKSALSLSSLQQIPWTVLSRSKVVYIGEVFVEVALSIATEANASSIPVVYQPSIPFLEMGLNILEPIFRQTDLLILSLQAWKYITSKTEDAPTNHLLSLVKGSILARVTEKKYSLFSKSQKKITRPCRSQKSGISQFFVAKILDGIIGGLDIQKSFNRAVDLESS